MENQTGLVMNVSQEELLYILRLINAPAIPGIDPAIYEGASEDHIKVAVGVAERALLARGFIKLSEEEEMKIDEVPLALIGTCAVPDFSILAEVTNLNTSQGVFWHGGEDLTVEHSLPLRGIHKFRALPDGTTLAERVNNGIPGPKGKSLKVPGGKIKEKQYELGKSLIRESEDIDQAIKAFQEGGLHKKVAERLAEVIENAETIITLGFLLHDRGKNEGRNSGGVGAFSSEGAFLIIPPVNNEDDNKLSIQPIGPKEWNTWTQDNINKINQPNST